MSYHTLTMNVGFLSITTAELHQPLDVAPSKLTTTGYRDNECDMMPMTMAFELLDWSDFSFDVEFACGTNFATTTALTVDRSQKQLLFPDYGAGPTGTRVGMADWFEDGFHNKPLDANELSIFDEEGHAATNSALTWMCAADALALQPAVYPRSGFIRANPKTFIVPLGTETDEVEWRCSDASS